MIDSQAMKTKEPDLAILLAAAYTAMTERLLDAMTSAGIEGMRPAFGFVIRAVAAEEPTINRLAELLEVSKQAASKLADDMVRAGFLERASHPDDRRSLRLQLSAKGRAVFDRARATSAEAERALRRSSGVADVETFRRVLLEFLEQHGALDDVLALRARPART
jgi:DNA-binding MarR family transcriptional regulator